MTMFLNALILAMLVPAAEVQRVEDGPACRAVLDGAQLVTTYERPDGLLVQGPWRVQIRPAPAGRDAYRMQAVLDHVVERDALTGERKIIPFPQPVHLAFEGTTRREAIQRAAQTWCVTIMRAQENRTLDYLSPNPNAAPRIASRNTPAIRA